MMHRAHMIRRRRGLVARQRAYVLTPFIIYSIVTIGGQSCFAEAKRAIDGLASMHAVAVEPAIRSLHKSSRLGSLLIAEARQLEHSGANGRQDGAKEKEDTEPPLPPTSAAVLLRPMEQYCSSVQNAASDARLEQQRSLLEQTQRELEQRIKILDARIAESKEWMRKRTDFLLQASDGLVEVYAKMNTEAAAAQLLSINERLAAAILSKLPPKTTSMILAEMDAKRAARLSSMLASVAELGKQQKSTAKDKR
jgi:flagellar motility protein MotE (MotC chaperone)